MSRQSRVMPAKMGPSWRPVIGSTKQRVRSTRALESTHPKLVAPRCRDAQSETGWRRGRCHDYQQTHAIGSMCL